MERPAELGTEGAGDCIAYLLRHKLMMQGCTKDQCEQVSVRAYVFAGMHPVLAVVYVEDADGVKREVLRVYDWDDLQTIAEDMLQCEHLAKSVRRVTA